MSPGWTRNWDIAEPGARPNHWATSSHAAPVDEGGPILMKAFMHCSINTTYSVLINHRPQGEITARCEYTHIDGSVISDEMEIKEATPPSAPKVSPVSHKMAKQHYNTFIGLFARQNYHNASPFLLSYWSIFDCWIACACDCPGGVGESCYLLRNSRFLDFALSKMPLFYGT